MKSADPHTTAQLWAALAGALEQVLQQVSHVLRQSGTRPRLTGELALTGARLCQLAAFLPADDTFRQQIALLHKLLPALLQPQETSVQQRLLVPLWKLAQALPPTAEHEPPQWRSRTSAPPGVLQLLADWWRRQQRNELPSNRLALHGVLQQLAVAVRGGAVEPAAVASLLTRLQVLLRFERDAGQREHGNRLLQQLAVGLLAPDVVAAESRMQCWLQWWQLVQGHSLPESGQDNCNDFELLQCVQADLSNHLRLLQTFLHRARAAQGSMLLSHEILVLHYRLPWVLEAAGQHQLSQLMHLWYRCLLQHWHQRVMLSTALVELLADTQHWLDITRWRSLQYESVTTALLQLLRLWPASAAAGVMTVPLPGRSRAPVPLAGIPPLLAQSFVTLNRCRTAWFADANTLAQHQTPLVAELRLLEQGAAAMKVQAVEHYCSLLLSLHTALALGVSAARFPAALLWRAHAHLLELLDEAAAWQDPQPDATLVLELMQWQQSALRSAVTEPAPKALPATTSAETLALRLVLFVDTLAQTVEQAVRLCVDVAPQLTAEQLAACEIPLQPLLRFIVLQQLQEATLRRQSHRPAATTVALMLAAGHDGVQVELVEHGCERTPDAQALRRLRRRLPDCVRQLQHRIEPAVGRHWRCVLCCD